MINLDALRRGPLSYLGWTLEGQVGKDAFKRFYVWYAWEDDTERGFTVRVRRRHQPGRDEELIGQSLALARGKIFLGHWRPKEEYLCDPKRAAKTPTPIIRDSLLRGLHRLYEAGVDSDDVQVDLQGIALELGAKQELVSRAVEFLAEQGLIEGYGTFGKDLHTGDFWITPAGVAEVESRGAPVEAFLEDLYEEILGRVSSLSQGLQADLEGLRGSVAQVGQSRNELKGYGARVRDFVEELTQRLYERAGFQEPIERTKTKNKVVALTAKAASETSQDHVRALAEVVETHWKRLNDVQQKMVHAGTTEAQRLLVYTLLFVADLFDVVDSA